MVKKLLDEDISLRVADGEGCEKIVSVEITSKRFEDEKARVLDEMVKEIALPGFRKGKVPPDIIKRRFADEIRSEAIKSILPLAYEHLVDTQGLETVGEPQFKEVRANDNEPLTFKVHLEVLPRIEISDYKGIAVPAEEITVENQEVEEVLETLRQRSSDYVPVDKPAAVGDLVTIEFVPIGEDGLPDEKRRAKNFPVQLGSGEIFPDFENALIGKKAGESGQVEISYPEDFEPKRLAGKKIGYGFTVIEVRERRVPELDDALASKIDERFSTLDSLREDIRTRLVEEKKHEAQRRRQERAIDILIEKHPFDVPRTMRERLKKELYEDEDRRRRAVGVGQEEDPEKRKQIEEFFDRISVRNIKRFFIMEHIAEKEGIQVTNEELEREIEQLAEKSGRDVKEIKAYLARENERLENLRSRLREQKVFGVILGS